MKVSMKKLRGICDLNRLGVTIREIVKALNLLDLPATPIKVAVDDVVRMPLPAILFWEQRHFVVLYKVSDDATKFYLVDPGKGKLVMGREEFIRSFQGDSDKGVAILCGPNDKFNVGTDIDNEEKRLGLIGMIKEAFTSNRRRFIAVIAFTLVTLVANVAIPFVFRSTIDDGIAGRDVSLVWLLVGSQLLIFLGSYVANWIVELMLTKLSLKLGMDMINAYLRKLIALPMDYFNRKVNSDLIQKAEDQNRIRDFLSGYPSTFIFNVLNLFVFSGLLVYFNKWIFLLFIGFVVLNFGWTTYFMRRRRVLDFAYISGVSENRNNLHEMVHGIEEIKINNAQNIRVGVWKKVQERINNITIKSVFLNFYINGGNQLFCRMRDISITGICSTLVIDGSMSIGDMMTVSFIVGQLSVPFSVFLNSVESIQNASMSYERLEEVMESTTHQIKCVDKLFDEGDIMLSNVSFKYPGGSSPMVLKDVNLVIPRNKTTAIVGESGSGKTTLIKLLIGLYVPTKGKIRIGESLLTPEMSDSWLKRCGMVMQDGKIFTGTILANVALSDEKPDQYRAAEALKMAGLGGFIATLPMGINTRIGVTGIEISGGQKQRLLIARAIYKNPAILVLDEATSSLDANNESSVVKNISGFSENRTVIIVAHRLSTVRDADNIVVIDNGEIAEFGNHLELLERRGRYYSLVKNQLEMIS